MDYCVSTSFNYKRRKEKSEGGGSGAGRRVLGEKSLIRSPSLLLDRRTKNWFECNFDPQIFIFLFNISFKQNTFFLRRIQYGFYLEKHVVLGNSYRDGQGERLMGDNETIVRWFWGLGTDNPHLGCMVRIITWQVGYPDLSLSRLCHRWCGCKYLWVIGSAF